jgi:hypothetical protein
MGDIARCSLGAPTDLYNEDTLYDLFGVNAELLIDHAWGREPCTIADIKAYKPEASSVGSGQCWSVRMILCGQDWSCGRCGPAGAFPGRKQACNQANLFDSRL